MVGFSEGVWLTPNPPPGSIPVFGTPFLSVELSSSACYRKERWRLFAEEWSWPTTKRWILLDVESILFLQLYVWQLEQFISFHLYSWFLREPRVYTQSSLKKLKFNRLLSLQTNVPSVLMSDKPSETFSPPCKDCTNTFYSWLWTLGRLALNIAHWLSNRRTILFGSSNLGSTSSYRDRCLNGKKKRKTKRVKDEWLNKRMNEQVAKLINELFAFSFVED